MITGILTIKMCSDWHIGSGAGRPSSIDRLVQRDQYNLPFIPAKSLTGIWRDSCELLAQGLDNGKPNGAWQQWVTWLFGEQQPEEDENRATDVTPAIAQLSVRSAHFPKTLQSALQNNVLLQSMTTFVKPGVSINPYTGSALAEHLRFEEMSRTGAILQAEYQLDCAALSPEQQKIAEAILVAGASMVERLGAKRRRGAGRCCITVDGLLDLKQAIAKIERATDLTTLPPIAQVTHQAETLTLAEQTDANWWCIELEVTTQSPIIVHRRTVGNHQETQDYIPGTYFLPIVRKQLEQDLDLSIGNALMHGDVVITNANPVIAGIQRRGEAVPFSIFAPKAKTVTPLIHQRIGEAIAPEFSGDQQLRGIRQGYVALQDQMLHRVVVDTEIAVHNTIVDAKQRPDTEVGGIYTYAAIPARQTFRLEVRIRESLVPQNVELLSNFLKKTPIKIGRTKKDDYGAALIQRVGSNQISPDTPQPGSTLTLWILSDLLLRDARLRPTVDLNVLAEKLGQVLGAKLRLLNQIDSNSVDQQLQVEHLVAFARFRRTESWQTRWSLPRPSLVGLSAGTVLQFQVEGTVSLSALRSLEVSGFGERTAEGYGQLCFNPALLLERNLQLAKNDDEVVPSLVEATKFIDDGSPTYSYAQLIEEEAWREMIRRAAGAIAADPDRVRDLNFKGSKLTLSKLGTLRSLLNQLDRSNDNKYVRSVLTRMGEKEKWKDKALDRVDKLVKEPEQVWRYYQEMGCQFSDYCLTQGAEERLKKNLWEEAVKILVDACIRAHKRASETQ